MSGLPGDLSEEQTLALAELRERISAWEKARQSEDGWTEADLKQ